MGDDSVGSMNDGNMARLDVPERTITGGVGARARELILVADGAFVDALGDALDGFRVVRREALVESDIVDAVAAGSSLVWIGGPDGLPADLWLGTFQPAAEPLASAVSAGSPLILPELSFGAATLHSGYIKPVKEMYYHNIDEEIRADFIPIIEARDRFGEAIGYPGVLMSHHSPSLVGRRFAGAECFFFLFDDPLSALDQAGWTALLASIAARYSAGMQIRVVDSDYASYRPGERARISARVGNLRDLAASVELRFYAKAPGDDAFRPIVSHRRCPDAGSESEAVCDLLVGSPPGLWAIRVEAWQNARATELAVSGGEEPVDRREIGFVVLDGAVTTPKIMSIDGPRLRMDGKDGFWAGTHYYPSSSWWEWLWRDFRPLQADRDFGGIRRTGYRIARIWVDPVLDERTLRAMDAGVYLAAQHGIVLDVCVFSQWVRMMGFERPSGEHVSFEFKHVRDGNVYSISLRNMDLQREYMRTLALRWKQAGNIVYNLANETYIRDPDESQMDPEVVAWDGIPTEHGALRDTLIFRRWAREISEAIRGAGADQAIIPSYMFSILNGGDNYLANRDGDIVPWHCYMAQLTGVTLAYYDPICTNRPLILEEFGALGWNPESNYDGNAHYGLAAGAAAAMAYEWGVSWMARDMCFVPLPLRDPVDEEVDPRWFEPYVEVCHTWPSHGVGICATPSGFGYGSIYHGTPFPARAAVALGRLGQMGERLEREFRPEAAYVLVPQARTVDMDPVFNTFNELWRGGRIVGTWQEDCLESLPREARVLICPVGVSAPGSPAVLDALRARGTQVFVEGDDGWKESPEIPRIELSAADGTSLLTRRTVGGTLHTLISEASEHRASVVTERGTRVSMGLQSYAMVHDSESGVRMIEASGDVEIGGKRLLRVTAGRAIVASVDDRDLTRAHGVRVIATEPTEIEFGRALAWYAPRIEGADGVPPTDLDGASALRIDGEMLRYPVEVRFAE